MPEPQQVHRASPERRRTTAAALKQATAGFLADSLPPGWSCLPLAPGRKGAPAADVLVLSPRGRCHFLFVRAPADRWWDGGPHSVPAEKLTPAEAGLAQRLRAAGHTARAIWSSRDLSSALRAWGCPLRRGVNLAGEFGDAGPCRPAGREGREGRARLQLAAWRSPADA